MSVAGNLVKVFKSADDDVYKSAIKRTLWSLDEASALIAGLCPENYKKGIKGFMNISEEEFRKRDAYATKIFSQMLSNIDKKGTLVKFIPLNNSVFFKPLEVYKMGY
jgi:hypothetical protein